MARFCVHKALGNVFTVLRSPVSHFKSSWSYWGVAGHIAGNGGPHGLDWKDFILDPRKYWPFLRGGDIDLIWNSMLFDFGLYRVRAQAARQLGSQAARAPGHACAGCGT